MLFEFDLIIHEAKLQERGPVTLVDSKKKDRLLPVLFVWWRRRDSTSAAAEAASRLWSAPGAPFTPTRVRIPLGFFQIKTAIPDGMAVLICLWGTKKMDLRFRQMDSNSRNTKLIGLCLMHLMTIWIPYESNYLFANSSSIG